MGYKNLTETEQKKLVREVSFLPDFNFGNFEIYSIAMNTSIDENLIRDMLHSEDKDLFDEVYSYTSNIILDFADRMLKYGTFAVSCDDLEELKEKYDCSLSQIRLFYNNDNSKNTISFFGERKRIGMIDKYKELKEIKKEESGKKKDNEFQMKIGRGRIVNSETLQAIHEKLNETKFFFTSQLAQDKIRSSKNSHFKDFLSSNISDIKKIRKHINLILNQKINLNAE